MERWRQHFEEVLNVEGPIDPVEEVNGEVDISIGTPSVEDITKKNV